MALWIGITAMTRPSDQTGESITDWADLMPEFVTVQVAQSVNDQGAPMYGSPISYRSRVNFQNRMIRNAQGDEVAARGRAWLATTDLIGTRDKILLPDGTTPQILNVGTVPDESGDLYTQIDFA